MCPLEMIEMGESQSRYGIMEELNNKKINEKGKLANIEKEMDQSVYETEKSIAKLKQDISRREDNYKLAHADWKREKEVALKMYTQEVDRKILNAQTEIIERDASYEQEFVDWKKSKENELKLIQEGLVRYKAVQAKKIADKKDIIEQIDEGIKSLKEMSAEQKE